MFDLAVLYRGGRKEIKGVPHQVVKSGKEKNKLGKGQGKCGDSNLKDSGQDG